MRKTTKKHVIVSLAAASVALLGVGVSANAVTANADSCLLSNPATSIRLQTEGTTGVRFVSQITSTDYENAEITEVGALVAPTGSYTGVLDLDNADGDIKKIVVEGTTEDEQVRDGKFTLANGNYEYRAYVSNVPESQYLTKLDVVYYYKAASGTQYTAVESTCVVDVATAALEDVQATQDDVYQYQVTEGVYSRYDEEMRADIATFLTKYDVTLPEDVTATSRAYGALTPENGAVTAFKNDVITLSKTIAEGAKGVFKVNEQEVETVCEGTTATAKFKLTENVMVTYENLYLLSGTVSNQITSYSLDYSTVQVKVMDGATEVASLTPDANGEFSAYVPNGNYTVSAVCTALAGEDVSVAVENQEAEAELVLNIPLVVSQPLARPLVYDKGVYTSYYVEAVNTYGQSGGYLAGATVQYGATFAIETELLNFATTGLPRAGFIVGSGNANEYMTFGFRNRGAGTQYDFVRERFAVQNVVGQLYGQGFFTTSQNLNSLADSETQTYLNSKPFDKGNLKMALVYYKGNYHVYLNDVLTFVFNENTKDLSNASIKDMTGTGNVSFGLFATEQKASLTNWSYSLDEASIVSKYFPAGQEMPTTSVGKYDNRPLYYREEGTYDNYIGIINDKAAYSTAGVYLAGAVAAENQTFAIETTVYDYADASGLGAGIIVGSTTTKNKFMAFALRRFGTGTTATFDFVQERVAGIDNSQRVYARSTFSDTTLANANKTTGLTMALVYKDKVYNIFFKVNEKYVKAFAFDENDTLGGADLQQSTKATIGTGAVRFGLYASEGGMVRLKDWSYSLDANAINAKYFAA